MPLGPPSAAIVAVLETVALARGFALVVVVGPDEHAELARWSLHEHLVAEGHEVLHVPAERLPDVLAATVERSTSGHPVVLVSHSRHMDADGRANALVRMNLRRDAWGDLPVRLVFTCSSSELEEFHRFASDLLHWRVLLQPLAAGDLSVTTWRTYFAWCIDEYGDRSSDRVLQGGMRALDDPLLVDLPAPDGVRVFSQWVLMHFRGVVVRAPTGDARYPAKGLARQWAREGLHGGGDVPAPLLVRPDEVPPLLARREVPGAGVRIEELWSRFPGAPVVAFLIDEGEESGPEAAQGLMSMGIRTFVITDREEGWRGLGWPTSLVLAALDPLVDSPSHDVIESLARLLASLFSVKYLQRWLGSTAAGAGRTQVAERLAEQLLRQGRINSSFFDGLLQVRPRARAEIERVRSEFVGLFMDEVNKRSEE